MLELILDGPTQTYENSWLYSQLNNLWAPWIGSSSTVAANGVYSVKHANTNLRIISLNTMLPYVQNCQLSPGPFERLPSFLIIFIPPRRVDLEGPERERL